MPVALQEIVRVVVYESTPDPEELVEPLAGRSMVAVGPEVPLPEEGRPVTRSLHSLGQGYFLEGHVDALLGVAHIPLEPFVDPAPLRMAPRQQGDPGRAAEGVGVGLGEAHPRCREFVDMGGAQVVRAVATRIEGTLVVGEENHHVGPLRCPGKPKDEKKSQGCRHKGGPWPSGDPADLHFFMEGFAPPFVKPERESVRGGGLRRPLQSYPLIRKV